MKVLARHLLSSLKYSHFNFQKNGAATPPRRHFWKLTSQTSLGSRIRSIQDMIKIFLHLKKEVQNYIQREKFVMLTLIGDSTIFYVNLL